jgi:hypothetical protein
MPGWFARFGEEQWEAAVMTAKTPLRSPGKERASRSFAGLNDSDLRISVPWSWWWRSSRNPDSCQGFPRHWAEFAQCNRQGQSESQGVRDTDYGRGAIGAALSGIGLSWAVTGAPGQVFAGSRFVDPRARWRAAETVGEIPDSCQGFTGAHALAA